MISRVKRIAQPLIALVIGLSLGLSVTLFIGENPVTVSGILLRSAFGSLYDFGMTLFYSTPLIFTGLSVALAFRAGLFNIGGEGQLAMGALAVIAFTSIAPAMTPFLGVLFCFLAAAIGGGLWGGVAGWLRAKRGTHEVISTIMLNFIAAGLTSYFVLYVFKNPEIQGPESVSVPASYMLPQFAFFDSAPAGLTFVIACILAVLLWYGMQHSVRGYEFRAIGENESAAQFSGIQLARTQILALFCSGALAGLVGASEILGNAGRFKIGFSPGYGFTGIAVALLARAHPIGVVFSAILFGALQKGTLDLEFETNNVTQDISQIIQAIVILCVSAEALYSIRRKKRER